jgi:hypothetical protein
VEITGCTPPPPPTRRPTANKVRGRGCQQRTCKQCTAGKQTLYSMGCQYSARHRGGRSASTGRIVYTLYCINIIYIPDRIRSAVRNLHTIVKRLLIMFNVLALAIFPSRMILSVIVVYFSKTIALQCGYYAVSIATKKNYTPVSFPMRYESSKVQLNCRTLVFSLCMEVAKKYNISVRKLFGKMSEPGERNDGGGPGKLPCITSNINVSVASKIIVTYTCLAVYISVCPDLNPIICHTIVHYSTGPSFDLCLVISFIALCLVMSCLVVTISNCSSRHGE